MIWRRRLKDLRATVVRGLIRQFRPFVFRQVSTVISATGFYVDE